MVAQFPSRLWGHVLVFSAAVVVLAANSGRSLAAELPAAETSSATPAPATNLATGEALRAEVRAFLRAATAQKGIPDEAMVRRGVDLFRRIQADTELRSAQREPLRLALRSKLMRWGGLLAARPAVGQSKPGGVNILAQVAPAGPLGGVPSAQAARPADHGQELVELIEATIAPTTWDTVGGNGSIRYWAPGNALIVRQTGDVHEQLGHLLFEMR